MNIECIKEKLVYAVGKAEKITGKNVTLPVLGCVLLEAKDSTLLIKATNLDIGIEISLPVKVNKPGKVAIPGTVFYQFISNITNDKNINLEETNGNLKVTTKHSETVIKTLNADDFPNIPKVDADKPFTFNVPNLIKGFKSVMYSSSNSTIRPVLSSILLTSEEDDVIFVATDSFRLAEKKVPVKKHKEFSQILIPFKNVGEIIRAIEDIKEDVEVRLNENQISFSHNDLYVTSRVVDGAFPDYKQIVPKETNTEVTLLKQDLVSSLRISNIFSDKFSQVTFTIKHKDKSLKITTKNTEVGENVNSIDAVVDGNDLNISFNYKYIIDCFQSIEGESVSLSFVDNSKAMIVRGVSDKSFMYLVMPMNK